MSNVLVLTEVGQLLPDPTRARQSTSTARAATDLPFNLDGLQGDRGHGLVVAVAVVVVMEEVVSDARRAQPRSDWQTRSQMLSAGKRREVGKGRASRMGQPRTRRELDYSTCILCQPRVPCSVRQHRLLPRAGTSGHVRARHVVGPFLYPPAALALRLPNTNLYKHTSQGI